MYLFSNNVDVGLNSNTTYHCIIYINLKIISQCAQLNTEHDQTKCTWYVAEGLCNFVTSAELGDSTTVEEIIF